MLAQKSSIQRGLNQHSLFNCLLGHYACFKATDRLLLAQTYSQANSGDRSHQTSSPNYFTIYRILCCQLRQSPRAVLAGCGRQWPFPIPLSLLFDRSLVLNSRPSQHLIYFILGIAQFLKNAFKQLAISLYNLWSCISPYIGLLVKILIGLGILIYYLL